MRNYKIAAVFCLLCAVIFMGCGQKQAPLAGVPEEAQLIYEGVNNRLDGSGVTLDTFENPDDVGFFVVEVRCAGGSVGQLRLEDAEGGTVASFGDVEKDSVFISDLQTDAAGSFALYGQQFTGFDGSFNVYFVPGLGYS